jgi:hypothetical protein
VAPLALIFELQIADRARAAGESSDDAMGLAYYVCVWLTWMIPLFRDEGVRRKDGRQRFLSPLFTPSAKSSA